MKLTRELAIFVLAFALAGLLVTALAGLFSLCGVEEAARWGRKPLVPLFVIAWFFVARTPLAALRTVTATDQPWRRGRPVLLGLLCGTAVLLAFDLLLISLDARRFEPRVPALELGGRIVLYLFQALALGILEETLFRGIVHGRLRKAAGPAMAIGLGSLLFAVAHFLRPPKGHPTANPLDVMPSCLAGVPEAFTDRWRECLGLFLVGAVLAILRERTGSVWLPVGVHAGWVWVQHVSRKALVEVHETLTSNFGFAHWEWEVPGIWFYGTKRIYDGLLGWSALLATLAISWLITRPRSSNR